MSLSLCFALFKNHTGIGVVGQLALLIEQRFEVNATVLVADHGVFHVVRHLLQRSGVGLNKAGGFLEVADVVNGVTDGVINALEGFDDNSECQTDKYANDAPYTTAVKKGLEGFLDADPEAVQVELQEGEEYAADTDADKGHDNAGAGTAGLNACGQAEDETNHHADDGNDELELDFSLILSQVFYVLCNKLSAAIVAKGFAFKFAAADTVVVEAVLANVLAASCAAGYGRFIGVLMASPAIGRSCVLRRSEGGCRRGEDRHCIVLHLFVSHEKILLIFLTLSKVKI